MDAKMPKTVVATGELYRWKENRDVPDTVNGIMVYPEGFTVNLSSTFNNQTGESGIDFLGTEGSLSFRESQLIFRPENVHSDNRWVVDSWPKSSGRGVLQRSEGPEGRIAVHLETADEPAIRDLG